MNYARLPMLRNKDINTALLGITIIAVVVVGIAYVVQITFGTIARTPHVLTNAKEVEMQRQLAQILASGRGAECATLADVQYRLDCYQVLSPLANELDRGTPLQTSFAEPMTREQLQAVSKQVSATSGYDMRPLTSP